MDLISSIFDDKRVQKTKSQGKANNRRVLSGTKAKRTTKSGTLDKNQKTTTARSVSHNGQLKNGNSTVDLRRASNESKVKEVENIKEKEKTIEPPNKEITSVDPTIIRHFSKYSQENDSLEGRFESALELYNDCVYDEKDAEFGRESFQSLDKDYFVEAYNKEGYELLETSIMLSFDYKEPDMFASDDESDNSFIETYNSVGYELRHFEVQESAKRNCGSWGSFQSNHVPSCSVKEKRTKNISGVKRRSSSYGAVSTRPDRTNRTPNNEPNHFSNIKRHPSRTLTAEIINEQAETVIRKELQQQNSIEEVHFEEKSIEELVKETHSPAFNVSNVQRSSSSTSKTSLRRFDSTSSAGSYVLASETIQTRKYDDSVDIDDEIPEFNLSFEIKTKADMIIQELLETERSYIEILAKIKKDYIRYFKRMNINSKGMFGNVLEILKETLSFYSSLQVCGNDYEYIGNTFKDYKHLFDLYPEYSKSKSHADLAINGRFKPILEDRQRFLGDKLNLASYLLNPIQRLGRYILLLRNLQKSVRKPECLEEALTLLEGAMKKGNDYVAIASISNCKVDLTTKGSYIDREKFILVKPKREEIVLFLFEQIVVFTYQKPNTENFMYNSSIYLDDLQIINSEGDDRVFQLRDYTKAKKERSEQHTYTLEARSVKLRETWVELIQKKLWEQLQQVKALSKTYTIPDSREHKKGKSPVYATNLVKKSANNIRRGNTTNSDRNSVKRNSKFYLDETSGYDTL